MILANIDVDAVYSLAAAVVKGYKADDPEREKWRIWAETRARRREYDEERPGPSRTKKVRRVGYMSTLQTETNTRQSKNNSKRKKQ